MSKGALTIIIIVFVAVGVFAAFLLQDRLIVSKNESEASYTRPAPERTIPPRALPVQSVEPEIETQNVIEETFDELEYNPFE